MFFEFADLLANGGALQHNSVYAVVGKLLQRLGNHATGPALLAALLRVCLLALEDVNHSQNFLDRLLAEHAAVEVGPWTLHAPLLIAREQMGRSDSWRSTDWRR